MTSTVGGLWDSLLAEGRPWWITANSDSHRAYGDKADGTGTVHADFWPGYYSRTHVGSTGLSYAAVMAGLRAGRVWVDHGGLLDRVEVRAVSGTDGVPLGGTIVANPGAPTRLVIDLDLASRSNRAGFRPRLAKVDVIQGVVTGPVSDPDTFRAPDTRVVRTFDTSTSTGTVRLRYDLGPVDRPCYLRIRGSDGNRTAPGFLGADVDPAGPAMDRPGNAEPWHDLWFYTNPIWVLPAAGAARALGAGGA